MSSKIRFYYGSMGCGKSTYAMQMCHMLTASDFDATLLKSSFDTRDENVIRSRIGFEANCISIDANTNVYDVVNIYKVTHIIVDEAQFLSTKNITSLIKCADEYNMEINLFGLRTAYTGKLFDASAEIMAVADELIELPLIYKDGEKAIMHIRKVGGTEVYSGKDEFVGDIDEEYESVSRREYFSRRYSN